MTPKPLQGIPHPIASLIEECLYKPAGARPNPSNVLARLERFSASAPGQGLARLQEANRNEVARKAEEARRDSASRSEAEHRAELLSVARTAYERISTALRDALVDAAPATRPSFGRSGDWSFKMGKAVLEFLPLTPTGINPWGMNRPAFDVIAHTSIDLRFPPDYYGYQGRSHSLWYGDIKEEGQYRWFETAFMIHPFRRSQSNQDPFRLDPSPRAGEALGIAMGGECQSAWPFTELVIGELDEFIDRWAMWLADAADGKLGRPGTMPERRGEGSCRRQ